MLIIFLYYCDSIIYILSVYTFLVMVNFIVLCVLTLTLWIEFIFRFEPGLINLYELG